MAIQRCPYCKAIIDEGAEYCSNCGTQLLFPEDENIDEEIPGEKIIDVDEEEEEPEVEEKSEEEEILNPEKKKDVDIKESTGNELEPPESKEETADVPVDLEEEKAKEGAVSEGSEEIVEPEEATPKEGDKEEIVEEVVVEEEEKEEIAEKVEAAAEEKEPELDTKDDMFVPEGEIGGPDKPEGDLDVEIEGLEKKADSETIQKEEIEQFVESLKKEREKQEDIIGGEEEFPPWAEEIKEGSTPDPPVTDEEVSEEPVLDTEAETIMEMGQTPPKDLTDMETESVLPETVDQQDLLFTGEEPVVEEEPEREVIIERSRPVRSETPSKIISWMKARLFDVLFITAVWFITVWIASQVSAVSVFQLLANSTTSIMIFLVLLLVFYFFFFYYFLKETLGDLLFTQDK